jgi:hypothetical protein
MYVYVQVEAWWSNGVVCSEKGLKLIKKHGNEMVPLLLHSQCIFLLLYRNIATRVSPLPLCSGFKHSLSRILTVCVPLLSSRFGLFLNILNKLLLCIQSSFVFLCSLGII